MPTKNFFADFEPEETTPSGTAAENNMPNQDFFASMQSIDLFDDAPQDAAEGFAALTDNSFVPQAAPTTAPLFFEEVAENKNIGAAVFQNLFADDEPEQEDTDAMPEDFWEDMDFDSETPAVQPVAAAPLFEADVPAASAASSVDEDPDVPSFMQRPASAAKPRAVLFDYDAESAVPKKAASLAAEKVQDDFAEPAAETLSKSADVDSFDFDAFEKENFEPIAEDAAATVQEEPLFGKATPAQPATPATPAQSAESAVYQDEMYDRKYRPVFSSGQLRNPVAEAKAARAAAAAARVAAALNVTQAPATPPAALAVPVLETPVDTPETAPVVTAPVAAPAAPAPMFEDFSALFPAEPTAPVLETPLFDAAPVQEISLFETESVSKNPAPFASNIAALLGGEAETMQAPLEETSFADNDFFMEDIAQDTIEMPSLDFNQSNDFAQTKVFDQPIATSMNQQQAPASFETEAPALNPFATDDWNDTFLDEADEIEDIPEDDKPVRRKKTQPPHGSGPKKSSNLPLIILLVVLIIAIIAVAFYALFGGKDKKPASSSMITPGTSTVDSTPSQPEPVEPVLEPIPRDEWYLKLVNKTSAMTKDEKVTTAKSVDGVEVDARIVEPLNQMIAAAKEQGINLKTVAGYRSYERQETSYNSRVAQFVKDGKSKEEAARLAADITAPPGTSEHNLGLSADIQSKTSNDYADSFKDSAEAKWLAENAATYGFILRYPQGKESITGFTFEPWHYRYVGTEQAAKIVASGLTLEEYLAQSNPTGTPAA